MLLFQGEKPKINCLLASSLRMLFRCKTLLLFLLVAQPILAAIDPNNPCAHQYAADVSPPKEIKDGTSVYTQIEKNQTDQYGYSNYLPETINQSDQHRKLIINLEPCKGIVYLFVRKTRQCFPNPYSCVDLSRGTQGIADASACEWTHFNSVIDGTRDGAPTFFELPFTSTKYFISVFAKEKSEYTLTVTSQTGSWPRPGKHGELRVVQMGELQVELTWDVATFLGSTLSQAKRYYVYSAMLLDTDKRTNSAIFLSKSKIMNTVCGLRNNTDTHFGKPIEADQCLDGTCKAEIKGVIVGKRYMLNVVAESLGGYQMAYAGLLLRTDWFVRRKAASEKTLQVVGAVTGSVFGMVIICYIWMVNLYGK